MTFKTISKTLGGFTLAFLLLTGITVFSTINVSAQRRVGRPVVIVRPIRIHRPFYSMRPFGWYDYGWYNGWNNPYSQYVFDNSNEAAESGYKQGYKTGEEDGRKNKSFSYERSHYYKEAGFGNFAEVYRNNFANGYHSGYEAGNSKVVLKAQEKAD